jgi:undecaprenyl-diphosphatase
MEAMHAIIVFCATYLIALPVAVIAYVEIRQLQRRSYELLVIVLLVSIVGLLLAKLASSLVTDPRPFVYGNMKALVSSGMDNGFPSDHTLLSSLLAVIGWHYSKKLGLGLGVVAAVVGWGRVAAHVHHLQDILASMIIAVLAYIIVLGLYRLARTNRRPPEPAN